MDIEVKLKPDYEKRTTINLKINDTEFQLKDKEVVKLLDALFDKREDLFEDSKCRIDKKRFENKIEELENEIQDLNKNIEDLEEEVSDLRYENVCLENGDED